MLTWKGVSLARGVVCPAVAIVACLVLSGTAQASILAPNSGATIPDIFSTCCGTVLATSGPQTFTSADQTLTFTFSSAVFSDSSICSGCLTFVYQIANSEHSTDSIVRMAGMDGFAMLREVRRRYPETGVVLMTAYATVPDAVEAIRGGAYDYLVKPFSLDQVGLVLNRLIELQSLQQENRTLRQAVEPPPLLESRSLAMERILETARRAALSARLQLAAGHGG